MTKTLTSFDFPAPVAEKASGASLVQQRNWIARGYLHSPIPPALAGKPRMFSLLGIYECAAYAHGSSVGIAVSILSGAFQRRVMRTGEKIIAADAIAAGRSVFSFWEGDAWKAGGDRGDLREFTDDSEHYFWVIAASGPAQGEFSVDDFGVVKQDDLGAAIANLTATGKVAHSFTILDISAVVRAVDQKLINEGYTL